MTEEEACPLHILAITIEQYMKIMEGIFTPAKHLYILGPALPPDY
jgi:hypothetical protein